MAPYHTDDRLIWTPTTNNANQELGTTLRAVLPNHSHMMYSNAIKTADVGSYYAVSRGLYCDTSRQENKREQEGRICPEELYAAGIDTHLREEQITGSSFKYAGGTVAKTKAYNANVPDTVRPPSYVVTFFRRIA